MSSKPYGPAPKRELSSVDGKNLPVVQSTSQTELSCDACSDKELCHDAVAYYNNVIDVLLCPCCYIQFKKFREIGMLGQSSNYVQVLTQK